MASLQTAWMIACDVPPEELSKWRNAEGIRNTSVCAESRRSNPTWPVGQEVKRIENMPDDVVVGAALKDSVDKVKVMLGGKDRFCAASLFGVVFVCGVTASLPCFSRSLSERCVPRRVGLSWRSLAWYIGQEKRWNTTSQNRINLYRAKFGFEPKKVMAYALVVLMKLPGASGGR